MKSISLILTLAMLNNNISFNSEILTPQVLDDSVETSQGNNDNPVIVYYNESGEMLDESPLNQRRATSYVKYTVLDKGTKYGQFVSYIEPYNVWTSGLDTIYIQTETTNYSISFGIAYGLVTAEVAIGNIGGTYSSAGSINVTGKTFRIYATADMAWEYCKGVEYDAYTNKVIQTFYFTSAVKVGQHYITETK